MDVVKIKEQFPKGTTIKCLQMNDPFHPVPPGTIGVVEHVDDMGTIHMNWENGSTLALIYGEDRFKKLNPIKSKDYER